MADDPDNGQGEDQKIVREAHKRLDRGLEIEAIARQNLIHDVKFGVGDARNGYQWDDDMRRARDVDARPSLTINKTEQHCLQIVNDARQNKAGIKVRPVGDEATYEAAQIYEGIIRHIEYQSNAQAAYDTATWWQVFGGLGYFRVLTDYVSDKSFDQDIFIRRVADPLTVLLDPDIKEYDGSDAKWGFVFETLPRAEAKTMWPDVDFDTATLGLETPTGWMDDETVRIAEYYRKSVKDDVLYALVTGETVLASKLRADSIPIPPKEAIAQQRKVGSDVVEWFKIVGNKIVDRREWPGKYIPICRVVGQETFLDGRLDRKGHVRSLLDPQRMYNFNSSAAIENMSLQTKIPWIAEAIALEGREEDWENANRVNKAVLTYQGWDDQGARVVPPPNRVTPPIPSQAYLQGMQTAQQEMMMVSGQYQAVLGAPSNETSGKAINARQRQGDNATYHFIDHLAQAIRYAGKILIDMIPRVYDTARIVKIMSESGEQASVSLDPTSQMAHSANGQPTSQSDDAPTLFDLAKRAQIVFNPTVGRYDIESDVGPSYQTQRQEEFNALTQILTQAPHWANVIGDLLFKAADFPGADDIAKRLKNMVPAQALGGPSQELMQAQGQIKQLQNSVVALTQALTTEKHKVADKGSDISVDQYKAETDRIKVLDGVLGPGATQALVSQLVMEALQTHLGNAMGDNLPQQQMPPGQDMMGNQPQTPQPTQAPSWMGQIPQMPQQMQGPQMGGMNG